MRVSATEFARRFASIQHEAHREPVAVTSHGRTTGYFLSPESYAEFEELKAKARRILRVGQLSDETLRAIRATAMDSRHSALNALMD